MSLSSPGSQAHPRFEWLIPASLFLLFLLITLPHIAWGAPDLWHPDEIIKEADMALSGEYHFDEENFNYPSLPKYTQYWLGRALYSLGYDRTDFIIAARSLSALLGGLVVVLAYGLVRMLGGRILSALLAAFLLLSSSELVLNSRFAHNDLYLTFFSTLAVLSTLQYRRTSGKGWLYLAFLLAGLATSSKYNGLGLVLVPLVVFFVLQGRALFKDWLATAETLFISFVLSALGYAIGTPKALLWMVYYFKRALPAILNHASYAREPGSQVGLVGQWGQLIHMLGWGAFILLAGAVVWYLSLLLRHLRGRSVPSHGNLPLVGIVLLALLALNLPLLFSYNYQPRFYLPMLPLLAALGALFVQDLYALAIGWGKKWLAGLVVAGAIILVVCSFLRVASVLLVFYNDARIPASRYVQTLPQGTSIEYTLYPPTIPRERFSRSHNYPIAFKKFPDQPLPTSRLYQFNQGEAGIEERKTDYLVIDSFTYARFKDKYICDLHRAECDFFARLRQGLTHYRLVQAFRYAPPAWLPHLDLPFVNPEIEVYQRSGE
jgi:hypothetical protein